MLDRKDSPLGARLQNETIALTDATGPCGGAQEHARMSTLWCLSSAGDWVQGGGQQILWKNLPRRSGGLSPDELAARYPSLTAHDVGAM